MVCSLCCQFYGDIVPTRCACGGSLRAATANQPRATADLTPLGSEKAQRPLWEAYPGYDEPGLGCAWLTPSLAGDALTHPTSPYAPVRDLTPPPPPAGLVQWHKTPPPHKLAQMSFVLLSAALLFGVTGSTKLGPLTSTLATTSHTMTLAEKHHATTTDTPLVQKVTGQSSTSAPDVTFTVQLPRPTEVATPAPHSPTMQQGDQHHAKHHHDELNGDWKAGLGNAAPRHQNQHQPPASGPKGKGQHHHR